MKLPTQDNFNKSIPSHLSRLLPIAPSTIMPCHVDRPRVTGPQQLQHTIAIFTTMWETIVGA